MTTFSTIISPLSVIILNKLSPKLNLNVSPNLLIVLVNSSLVTNFSIVLFTSFLFLLNLNSLIKLLAKSKKILVLLIPSA